MRWNTAADKRTITLPSKYCRVQCPYGVNQAIAAIAATGIKYEVGPMETTVEGDIDSALAAAKAAHLACFEAGAERVDPGPSEMPSAAAPSKTGGQIRAWADRRTTACYNRSPIVLAGLLIARKWARLTGTPAWLLPLPGQIKRRWPTRGRSIDAHPANAQRKRSWAGAQRWS
jgi:hypothetical protein